MARGDVRIVVEMFKEYYISINKISELNIKVSDNLEKAIIAFCDKVREYTDSVLQPDYLRRYFEFQFNQHYKKRGVRGGRGEGSGIKLTWIMSKTAWKAWISIEDIKKETYKVRKGLKGNVKIIKKERKENYNSIIVGIIPEEEKVKVKFLNTRKGFTLCTGLTLMFNHHSENCCSCNFSSECKDILKEEYPRIYKKRGYE